MGMEDHHHARKRSRITLAFGGHKLQPALARPDLPVPAIVPPPLRILAIRQQADHCRITLHCRRVSLLNPICDPGHVLAHVIATLDASELRAFLSARHLWVTIGGIEPAWA